MGFGGIISNRNIYFQIYKDSSEEKWRKIRGGVKKLIWQERVTVKEYDERGVNRQEKWERCYNCFLGILQSVYLNSTQIKTKIMGCILSSTNMRS